MKIYKVIGLMSGTSLDGVDVALLHTDGEGHIERKAFLSVAYDDALRAKIRACFGKTAADAKEAERALTEFHAGAIGKLGVPVTDIDLIGFHGQTIFHAPEK